MVMEVVVTLTDVFGMVMINGDGPCEHFSTINFVIVVLLPLSNVLEEDVLLGFAGILITNCSFVLATLFFYR